VIELKNNYKLLKNELGVNTNYFKMNYKLIISGIQVNYEWSTN
jgi:hypothetical protein